MRIGVIAGTHGLFDPALIEHFAGVTTILHAGDIGDPEVIRQLERIAPVVAVSGNVDEFEQRGFLRVCAVAGGDGAIAYVSTPM